PGGDRQGRAGAGIDHRRRSHARRGAARSHRGAGGFRVPVAHPQCGRASALCLLRRERARLQRRPAPEPGQERHRRVSSVTPRVGVDVAAIPRIAEAQKRFGDRFLHRFLTDREIDYCGGSPERWAGRWAAKEAIGKAMPTGVGRPRMRDVEILPRDDGRPHVRVAPATTLTGRDIDVSIAHDGHFAVAVAVIPEVEAIQPRGALPDGFRLPARPRDGHKGTFGTVVVLAGSQGYTVAPYLASMGAARSGAGIVRLLVAQSIYPILAEKCTEVIVGPIPEISPGVVGH